MSGKIIFLKGLPASGKSTWAKKYCIENAFVGRINKDDIREEWGNPEWSSEFEKKVLEEERRRGMELLSNGYSLIVDDTNFADKHKNYWQNIAKEMHFLFEEKFFDTPVEECIKRDLGRKNPVGEAVIRSMFKKYLKKPELKKDERFILDQDPTLPRCVIFDIDGTLALMDGRNPFDESEYINDKLNVPVYNMIQDYYNSSMGTEVILLSGRMDTGREQTEGWLTIHKVPYDKLLMRKARDFRADEIVKKEIYDEFIKDKYFVDFVCDDRDRCIKVWRGLGLLALQVYYGDF